MVGNYGFNRRIRGGKLALACALFLGCLTSLAGTAAAQDKTVDVVNGVGEVTVIYSPDTDGGEDGNDDGGNVPTTATEWPWTCEFWIGVTPEDLGSTTTTPVPERYYHLVCSVNPSHIGVVQPINIPAYQYQPGVDFAGLPGARTSLDVRQVAQNTVVPEAATPGVNPPATQITGIETWFWPDGDLTTITGSATAGGLTVTVQAEYVSTTFTIGTPGDLEAESFVCDSFVVWTPDATGSECTYALIRESASQTIAAESSWDFSWYDNAAQPTPTDFERWTFTEVIDVEVVDLEAVIARN